MRRFVQWFVENPIAANLLMVVLLVGGAISSGAFVKTESGIRKEAFPANDENYVYVDVFYPGAAPSEVEQQIIVRIEEQVADLIGVFRVTSASNQGSGRVTIEVNEDYDPRKMLNDVKARIDAINTFPDSMERPIISQSVNRALLGRFSLYGDVDKSVLKSLAYQIRDELSVKEGISTVFFTGYEPDELSIEVSERVLREYNLNFDEIASAIRRSSINLPAGTIRSELGNVQVQTRAQAYSVSDFANVVVRSNPDGTQLLLGDIAEINDGFAENEVEFSANGMVGIDFQVFISDDPDLFAGSKSMRTYVDELRTILPEGVFATIDFEVKDLYDSRFNLLKDNALGGLVLVFIVLMLFLRVSLALWVVVGIITTFAGTIWALPYFGISLNMLSMFAFITVLGIVVDDAIIVGESIHTHQQNGLKGATAATVGANIVLKPVFLAVASTIIFFTPMVTVPGDVKPYTLSIFFVVLLSLIFSLVESLLILPSHLSHAKEKKPSRFEWLRRFDTYREKISASLVYFAKHYYQPLLGAMLRRKASTIVGFIIAFSCAIALLAGGWLSTRFFPNPPQPFIWAIATYPDGSPHQQARDNTARMVDLMAMLETDETLLAQNSGKPFTTGIKSWTIGNSSNAFWSLTSNSDRSITVKAIEDRFREVLGPLPEAKNFTIGFGGGGTETDIELKLNLSSNMREEQVRAVESIDRVLSAYPGVNNVRNDLSSERMEIELDLKEHAQTLGISLQDIARQVRQGFYGEEIQRIPREKEDVRVMLRYPLTERKSIDSLMDMRIRTAQGVDVPIEEVANITLVPGPTSIQRADRKRSISITAEVDEGFDAAGITNQMLEEYHPVWKREFAGFNLSIDGGLRTQSTFEQGLSGDSLKALIVVLVILAIAFRSLFQPFLVILAIPFGFMGAVFGHMLLGFEISIMSFIGLFACSGVVVNDNLVLIDRINQLRHQGQSLYDSVYQAGLDRFRPIVLTSITTFVGLLPILFERSEQAQFLIPMVISLSFGVMLSSVVTLFLVPTCYLTGYASKSSIKTWFLRRKAVMPVASH